MRLRGDRPDARSRRRARTTPALIGRKTRSGLKSVTMRRMIRRNFAPSRASRIFDVPTRGRASTGSNVDVVAGLDERQRRGRRRREAVRQQVDELAQVARAARARKPDVRSGIVAPGQVAGEPVERAVAEPARLRRLRRRRTRAPMTRSYSPSRATSRTRIVGLCWPSPSTISTYSPVARADAAS